MIAHVGGAPVEEALLPLLSGVGGVSAGLLVARAWVATRVRRLRRSGSPRGPGAPDGGRPT